MTPARAFNNEPPVDFGDPSVSAAYERALASIDARLGTSYPLVIGGRDVWSDARFRSIDPSRPDSVVGEHVLATEEHVAAAVAAAEDAFPAWSRTPVDARISIMQRAADLLIERRYEFSALMAREVGKTRDEADGEVAEAADLLRWYSIQVSRVSSVHNMPNSEGEVALFSYVPLGVGVVISPWNFPLALTIGMTSAALVCGNTVVLKPASASPTSVSWLVGLLREAGLPDGVLNYLTGSGSIVGDALVDHPRVRFIAFTGSKETGIRIYERAARVRSGQGWFKRVQLETGGKNAVIVDETADFDLAAQGIITSAFGFQGQKCSAGSRAIIVGSIYDDVLDRVVELTRKLSLGDPAIATTTVGPLIDEAAFQKVRNYVELGKSEGRLVLGGGSSSPGFFVEPTIFADVHRKARIAQEEIFGPVLAFMVAEDWADALDIANDTEYGLTGSVYSQDRRRIEQSVDELIVGNLYVNRKSTGAVMGVHPFGGFKMSGTDTKAGGPDYLSFFVQGKSVGERIQGAPPEMVSAE